MILYKVFLKTFSKQGYSLFVMKEAENFTTFISEDFTEFPYFTKKQTRLLESVFREIKEKVSKAPKDLYEETRIEIWVPPVLFFPKLERTFLKKLIVLCNSLATNSKMKMSIKSYKTSLKSFLNYKKMRKILKYNLWYQQQCEVSSLDLTEF